MLSISHTHTRICSHTRTHTHTHTHTHTLSGGDKEKKQKKGNKDRQTVPDATYPTTVDNVHMLNPRLESKEAHFTLKVVEFDWVCVCV
jgi:hypothetical protein